MALPVPSAQMGVTILPWRPPSDLLACEWAFDQLLASGEGAVDEVCGVVVAALSIIWESGQALERSEVWLARVAGLLARNPSACAAAALHLHALIAGMLGSADLLALEERLPQLRTWVEAADSDALRMLAAAAQANLWVLRGQLHAAQECVRDAAFLAATDERHVVPTLFLAGSAALVEAAGGQVGPAGVRLSAELARPELAKMPLHLRLTLHVRRLLWLAQNGTSEAIHAQADELRSLVIPAHRAYQRSLMHYALGVADLMHGQPAAALAHARWAIEQAELCRSVAAQLLPGLLAAQAELDLGRQEQAMARLAHLEPRWCRHGMAMQQSAAALERARQLHRQGRDSQAQDALQAARLALSPGEPLPALHRQVGAIHALVSELEVGGDMTTAPLAVRVDPQAGDPGGWAPVTSQPWIEITTLGRFALRVGGRWMPEGSWRGRRSKTLLKALIALGGREVPIERLCDVLWPDADGAQARQNLKVALWRLRRLDGSLGGNVPRWIFSRHAAVSLDSRLCRVDAMDLANPDPTLGGAGQDAWARLNRYEGDFLPDDDVPPVLAARDRIRREFVAATLATAQAVAEGVGSVPLSCLTCLARVTAMQPAGESAHELLMTLYLRSGRISDAMVVYLRAERMLKEHLGVDPGPGLMALREKVVRALDARHLVA